MGVPKSSPALSVPVEALRSRVGIGLVNDRCLNKLYSWVQCLLVHDCDRGEHGQQKNTTRHDPQISAKEPVRGAPYKQGEHEQSHEDAKT
jgi:hypothetical protein